MSSSITGPHKKVKNTKTSSSYAEPSNKGYALSLHAIRVNDASKFAYNKLNVSNIETI